MIDPNQAFQLTTKAPLIDGSNFFSPGIYPPGGLPAKFLIPAYGHNVGNAPAPSALITELQAQPIEIDKKIEPVIKPIIDIQKIDINTATGVDLKTVIEEITKPTADRIILDRDKNGNFKSLQDLLERFPALAKFSTTLEENFSF